MTRYAEYNPSSNTHSFGEKIVRLSYEEAKAWAEEHMDADDYEKEFKVKDEDELNEKFTFLLPQSLNQKLTEQSERERISKKDILVRLIREYYSK